MEVNIALKIVAALDIPMQLLMITHLIANPWFQLCQNANKVYQSQATTTYMNMNFVPPKNM